MCETTDPNQWDLEGCRTLAFLEGDSKSRLELLFPPTQLTLQRYELQCQLNQGLKKAIKKYPEHSGKQRIKVYISPLHAVQGKEVAELEDEVVSKNSA